MAPKFDAPDFEEFLVGIDCLDVKRIQTNTTLRAFIAGMLSYYPWWLVMLYRIREILVRILGLVRHDKPEVLPSFQPDDISFTPGEPASFFSVRKAEEEKFWISETPEDKHLKAFFGVAATPLPSGLTEYQVITAVRYLHWTGPIYFNLIRPFHHVVLRQMMKAGAKGVDERATHY